MKQRRSVCYAVAMHLPRKLIVGEVTFGAGLNLERSHAREQLGTLAATDHEAQISTTLDSRIGLALWQRPSLGCALMR